MRKSWSDGAIGLLSTLAMTALVGCRASSPPVAAPMASPPPPTRPVPIAEDAPRETAAPAEDPCAPLDARVRADDTAANWEDLATCQSSTGRLIEALRSAQKALETALVQKDVAMMKTARVQVRDLLDRLPHLRFELEGPPAESLYVTFDDRAVPVDRLQKKFNVNPGTHRVKAYGRRDGRVVEYEEHVTVRDAEDVVVRLRLN